MTRDDAMPMTDLPAGRRMLPALLLLFMGSGCAALIYEVVWLQLLQLLIGSTAVSMGVLLGTFMGGMCAGSLLLPRVVSSRRHPLRVYAALELGIGLIGLAILFGLPAIEREYVRHAGYGLWGILSRGAVAGVCLLPPTLLMGATLPAIARRVEADPEGVAWLGFFYGGNIVGAVFGCLLAGFYLLRVFDAATAVYVACGINVAAAGIALVLSTVPDGIKIGEAAIESAARRPAGTGGVYLAIALSGMSALGAEVVWTRLLSLLLGATVYTFSLILAVFLIGLGIGSSVGAMAAGRSRSPRGALAACQWILAAGIGWAGFMIAESLPYWPILPEMAPSPWYVFQVDLVRSLWAVLPPAILWGASFPLALAAVASRGQDPGRLVGGVYAANTIGAIVGALAFSLWLVPAIGTAGAERVLIGLAAASAVAAMASLLRPRRWATTSAMAVLIAAAGCLAWGLPPVPWMVVAFGRQTIQLIDQAAPGIVEEIPKEPGERDIYCTYVGEGANVSVAVTESREGVRSFHGAGKVQATNRPMDMRLQRMLGHLPALVHPKPRSVLVVACGAGVTAGTFVLHPDVERIVICDIEPMVPQVVTPMFGEENYHVVDGIARQNPHTVNGKQVEVVYDDGRHFLRTTRETFDIITSDPIDPWVKGCAALNTVEYYQMCREHLNPGGVVSLWIPLYESNMDTSRSVIATFFRVFPRGILWSNERESLGAEALWGGQRYAYDAVLFGQAEPTVIDVDAMRRRLGRPEYASVKESLAGVGFGTSEDTIGFDESEAGDAGAIVIDMLSSYAGRADLLEGWSRGAQINTDANLRLQYLAGMGFNTQMTQAILASILSHYRFPIETFVGPTEQIEALRQALARRGRRTPIDDDRGNMGSDRRPDATPDADLVAKVGS